MAIELLNIPDILQPVISVQEFTLFDDARDGSVGLYYQLDISVGDQLRIVKQLPDEYKEAAIDIQNILQAFFTSDVFIHDSFIENFEDGIKTYNVTARSYVGTEMSGEISTGFIIFNGVDLYNRTWDLSTYLMDVSANASFITTWQSDREIHFNDDIFFQYFQITGLSELDQITITKTDLIGDTSVATIDLSTYYGTSDVSICSLNLGPTALNTKLGSSFIDASVVSYVISNEEERVAPVKIDIVPEDGRYSEYYRIFWVNSLGATEAFNFDLVPENTISIAKEKYVNDRVSRTFGTKVEDKYLVRSNWICEDTSKDLKNLWHTPAAALYKDGIEIPIIIDESSKTILNRHNAKPINYTLSFTYAEEYAVQRN